MVRPRTRLLFSLDPQSKGYHESHQAPPTPFKAFPSSRRRKGSSRASEISWGHEISDRTKAQKSAPPAGRHRSERPGHASPCDLADLAGPEDHLERRLLVSPHIDLLDLLHHLDSCPPARLRHVHSRQVLPLSRASRDGAAFPEPGDRCPTCDPIGTTASLPALSCAARRAVRHRRRAVQDHVLTREVYGSPRAGTPSFAVSIRARRLRPPA